MQKIQDIASRLTNTVMAGGAAFAAGGVMQVVHPQEGPDEELIGTADFVSLGLFAAGLLLITPAFVMLARYARDRRGGYAAGLGTLVLGLTCITSLINGEDLSIFVVFAPLTNALWLFGSIALAVSLKRAGQVPRALYTGLPLAWVATIPLSHFGGGLLAGAFWLAVGYLLTTGGIARTQPAVATA